MRSNGPTLAISCALITLLLCGFNMPKAVLISAAVGLIKPTLPADLPFLGFRAAFFWTFPFPFTGWAMEAAALLSSALSFVLVLRNPGLCLLFACLDPASF